MSIKLGTAIILDIKTTHPYTLVPTSATAITAWCYKNLDAEKLVLNEAATATVVSAFPRVASAGEYGVVVSLPSTEDANWAIGAIYNLWVSANVAGEVGESSVYSFGIAAVDAGDMSAQMDAQTSALSGQIAALNNISQSQVSGMVNQSLSSYPVALSSQVTSAVISGLVNQSLSSYQVANSGQIAALNNLSQAQVSAMVDQSLSAYPVALSSQVTSATISGLMNQSLSAYKTSGVLGRIDYTSATSLDSSAVSAAVNSSLSAYKTSGVAGVTDLVGITVTGVSASVDQNTILSALSAYKTSGVLGKIDYTSAASLDSSAVSAAVDLSLSAYQVATSAQITALNNLSQAQVSAMVNNSLSAYKVSGVASIIDLSGISVSTSAISAAVAVGMSGISGIIISGVTSHGDIYWTKVVGIPIEQFRIILE